jgi:hypothetical protein
MPGANREIHRPLQLVTPHVTGPDVNELQESINDRFKDFKLPGRVDVDGEFGPRTKRRSNRVLYLLGADPKGKGPAGPVFTKEEQRLIRNPDALNKKQKERSKRRVEEALRANAEHDGGAKKAVEYAMSKRGTTEVPLGSNRGPDVDLWTKFCGLTPPVFWCGCFAAYCAVHAGGADSTPGAMVHNVVMLNYARSNQFGLTDVSADEVQGGDIVSYTFAHIGLMAGPVSGGRLHTVEGNTGQTGQQNNGGGVYEHTDRTTGLVLGFIRPNYGKEQKV